MKAKYTQVNFTTLHRSCSNEWAKPKAHSKYSKLDQTHTQKYTISPQLQPIIAFTVASWYTAWINIRSKGSPMVLTQHMFSKSLWEVTDIHSCSWHRTLRAAVELSLDFARAYKYLAGAPKQHRLTTRLDFNPPVDPQQVRQVNGTKQHKHTHPATQNCNCVLPVHLC